MNLAGKSTVNVEVHALTQSIMSNTIGSFIFNLLRYNAPNGFRTLYRRRL